MEADQLLTTAEAAEFLNTPIAAVANQYHTDAENSVPSAVESA